METKIPLPLFKIDKEFNILEFTGTAADLFPETDSLYQIIDRDSHTKLKNCLINGDAALTFEINAKTKQEPLELFKVFAQWNGPEAFCIFVPANQDYNLVHKQLEELQMRLSETNFELYEKKEQLSSAMDRTNRLSGPYIELSDTLALLPIFGDLSEEKITAVQDNAIQHAYDNKPERVLVDFTGVGVVEESGVLQLKDMVLVFKQMGMDVVIIGLSPAQARVLKPYRRELELDFERNAKVSIKKWLVKEYL
jgi:rsbT co-antagonist protein RsbR